jgi:nitrogen fixation/metabolism regulation signal transduction histidine kinase
MVNEFSRITRFPDSKLEKNDIIKIIEEIFSFVNNAYKNVEFSLRHKENAVYLFIDRYQVRRAILNIIYNSIDAVAENGKIWIDCYTNKGKKGSYTISISDNGAGIEDDIKGKIFNPYFSTKDRGAGLGLVIVEKIVFDNKARIWFESTSGKTTFFMEFLKA